ncbi:MAG TPA: ATP-grasp domain-containing protein [Bacilli bacterium]
MNSVLLTDGQLRKTLAAVRSLGKKGVPAYVAETTRCNISAFSRYCKGNLLSPDPAKHSRAYAEWLAETMARKQIDILFPMDDRALAAVMKHADLFANGPRMVLPEKDSWEKAADKGKAVEIARQCQVPIPATFAPKNPDQVADLIARLPEPLVIKPRRSSGSRGIRVVKKRELLEQYFQVHAKYPFPLIQEYIPPGERFDVCLLYDFAGRLKASFVQRELRHFPVAHGPSTLQESVRRPDLLELSLRIMDKLPWRGIVELEFMVDPRDGAAKFMEINPRFWNSLQTAILSGIDFPWMLYQIACGEKTEETRGYKEGVLCRNLLPGDMLHYLANPHRGKLTPGFWRGPGRGVADDILSRDDPLPAFGFMLACLRYIADPKAWNMVISRS